MSYQIQENKVADGYNLHVWVEHESDIETLLAAFDTVNYVKHLQVVEPLMPHDGRFPSAVFLQVPNASYVKPIRGRVMNLLGVNREVPR